MNHKYKKIIINIFIILSIIIVVLFYKNSIIVKELIKVLLISFVVAYTLKPIHRWIVNKYNINKKIIAVALILGVIVFLATTILFLVPSVFKESLNLEEIMNSMDKLISWLNERFKYSNYKIFSTIYTQINEKINAIMMEYSLKFIDSLIDFSEDILSLAVVPVVSYYFLADGEFIGKKFLLLFSSNKRGIIKDFGTDIDRVLGKYILSQVVLCLIVGGLTFIGLIVFKVKFPLFLSILNAVLNIIPYFGAIIGAIPIILIALIDSPLKALWVTILCLTIQQIEGNIISPQITSSSISMHPLTVIILLLIGDKVGGFMGMILAIPIGVIIKVIYEDINYNLF